MSNTYSLVCHKTKKRIWIGQGWGEMTSFYTGEATTMERLRRFLNEHRGCNLEFVCDDRNDSIYDYEEFLDPA